MKTEHLPQLIDEGELRWSDPDEKGVVMSRTVRDDDFYFVQEDLDSVWAGIITGYCAWSQEVLTVEDGKRKCEADYLFRQIGRMMLAPSGFKLPI